MAEKREYGPSAGICGIASSDKADGRWRCGDGVGPGASANGDDSRRGSVRMSDAGISEAVDVVSDAELTRRVTLTLAPRSSCVIGPVASSSSSSSSDATLIDVRDRLVGKSTWSELGSESKPPTTFSRAPNLYRRKRAISKALQERSAEAQSSTHAVSRPPPDHCEDARDCQRSVRPRSRWTDIQLGRERVRRHVAAGQGRIVGLRVSVQRAARSMDIWPRSEAGDRRLGLVEGRSPRTRHREVRSLDLRDRRQGRRVEPRPRLRSGSGVLQVGQQRPLQPTDALRP